MAACHIFLATSDDEAFSYDLRPRFCTPRAGHNTTPAYHAASPSLRSMMRSGRPRFISLGTNYTQYFHADDAEFRRHYRLFKFQDKI